MQAAEIEILILLTGPASLLCASTSARTTKFSTLNAKLTSEDKCTNKTNCSSSQLLYMGCRQFEALEEPVTI